MTLKFSPTNGRPCKRTYTETDRGETTFDVRDQKGRVVGYRWTISTVDVHVFTAEEIKAWKYAYYTHTEGWPLSYFRVWGTPTRDGKDYGPAFSDTFVATGCEAVDLVAKRIKAARQRDTKKFVREVAA